MLSTTDITAGLREALRVGTQNVVGQIGAADGFHAHNTDYQAAVDSLLAFWARWPPAHARATAWAIAWGSLTCIAR